LKRGDVYWAQLSPRSGSEQTGRRPVIIISHDAFNQTTTWRSIIVIPFSTSTTQARRGPTVVAVKAGIAGLPDDCSALCHQITTLDRAKLTDKIGELPLDVLGLVEQALLAAVGVGRG
jgi:mRNA interferase MazF